MARQLRGVPEVTRADVSELILGLTPSAKYPSADLYKRYATIARQAGREPGSRNALGRILHNIGCEPRKIGTGGKARAAWLMTGEAIMNARWHQEHGEHVAPGHE
jgi:hypothetical protein